MPRPSRPSVSRLSQSNCSGRSGSVAQKRRNQHHQHLADVPSHAKTHKLADIIVNGSAFLDSRHNRRKVIVEQHQVAGFLRNIRTGDTIATPMSARRRAGASFTPSPVIETMCPRSCKACTMRIFGSGETRAKTFTSSTTACSSSGDMRSSSTPVSTILGPKSHDFGVLKIWRLSSPYR